MPDIFIAHAGPDGKLAEALYDELSPKADCFLDTRDVLPGDNWDRVIARAQQQSWITVVIVSSRSDDAYYERDEVAAAVSYARASPDSHRVVPLIYDSGGTAPPLMPYGLRLKHAISVGGEKETARAAHAIFETLTVMRATRRVATETVQPPEQPSSDDPERPVESACLCAFDIKEFSRFNADQQVEVYTTLNLAISGALTELGLKISETPSGTVFWSQGGDGGILSKIGGESTSIFRLALLTFSFLRSRIACSSGPPFSIVAALDCGLVHIRPDLNGAPNIWGEPPNRVHRALEACEPDELLASTEFVQQLRSQTNEFDDLIGPRRLRATKRDRLLRVHRILTDVSNQAPQSSEPIDIVDFEAPNRTMVTQYRRLAQGASEARSGVWSLLLARRRCDLGHITPAEYRRVVNSVSSDGPPGLTKPHHDLFSRFSSESLAHLMDAGAFLRLEHDEELCHAGDDAHEMYIVAEGRIDVIEDGTTVVTRGPGELVGEMALVEPITHDIQTGGMLRSASLVAADKTTVFAIPYSTILERSDDIAAALVAYYERRRKESILTGDHNLKPVLQRLTRGECDALVEATELRGVLESDSPSSLALNGPGLLVAGSGTVMLRVGHSTEHLLRDGDTRPILLVPDREHTEVQVNAVRNSEFAYLDDEAWINLSGMAEHRQALSQLRSSVDRWELDGSAPAS
ncbi:MAG TPA: TIR domain-containing protein [Acidimicrobiales bacterium]|nr:TIR domain-containing protein [Acidimicrobiales bacterium]